MPDSIIDAQGSVFANGVSLAQDLSELAAILGSIGISGEGGAVASEGRAGELVQTASKVLRGLMRQLDGVQIQRNMLATHAEDWFWQWDMAGGMIRIETPPSLRGPKKRHETRSWGTLIHPDDVGAMSSINGFSVSGHDYLQVRTRMRDAAGEWRNIEWQGRIADRDKTGIGSFAAGTLKLVREQALSAGLASERDDRRAKLDFLANISHEIRTPMTAILGAAYLAMEINDPFQQKELARTIKASTESLVELLDDALDFTKLEAGMVALETVEFDFRVLMAETARIYGLDAQRKGLEFIFRTAPDVPVRLVSDPVRIRQIVANLLGNAVKFTNGGEIELAVNALPRSDSEGAWAIEISIRDTGIGIPPSKQSAIFEMFTQADASTTRKFGGTGVGLSICRHLASLLGGAIRVESQPGEGSTFYLDIVAMSAPSGAATKKPSAIAGQSVLILERNPAQRDVLSEMVATLGGNPVVFEERRDFTLLAQNVGKRGTPPSLALIDPDFAGIKTMATEQLWESRLGLAENRIIFMKNVAATVWDTGFLHDADSPSLLKPFSIDDLESAVAAVFPSRAEDADLLLDPNIGGGGDQDKPRIRVLLAEDNQTSREIIAAMLRRAGYEVDAVANGAEAVEAYQLEPFAFGIVLMDIQMPVMDGFEAAEGIRACEERRSWVSTGNWHSTPILAMTADALKNIETRCRDAGMNGVLIKPSTPEVLFATIERTITEAKNATEQKTLDAAWQQRDALAASDELARKQGAINELSMRLDKTLLDLNVPLEWVGKDLRALKQLISSFLDEVPGFIRELDRDLMEGKLAEVSRLLHRMKSSLKILGAGETCRLTEALYEACNAKDHEQAMLNWVPLLESLVHLTQLFEIVCSIL